MKTKASLFVPAFVAVSLALCPLSALTQQSTSAPAAQELPDAPTANVPVNVAPNGPTVVMDTSMGRITCQFYQKQAPKTVANFIGLASGSKDWTDPASKKVQHHKPMFDGTTFHRVIPEFMIQGGDPTGTGMGDPGYAFEDEIDPNLTFDRPGRLAMANSGPNTNGSQFFITEAAYDSLNGHYSLFGQCDDASVEVVKAIARVPRDADDKPRDPVMLKKVTIVPEGQAVPPPPAASSLAPDTSAPRKRIYVSAEVAQGLLVKKVPLAYPQEAKAKHISGTVVLKALIGTDGHIEDLTVVSGPQELQQAALDAVRNWEYRPYLVNGEHVEVGTTINTFFMLSK